MASYTGGQWIKKMGRTHTVRFRNQTEKPAVTIKCSRLFLWDS